MSVGLFVPCYVDQFYPQVAVAALELLEKLDVKVVYPEGQICCGQPMANSGFEKNSEAAGARMVEAFKEFEYIVGLSGSCVLHVKDHVNHQDPAHTLAERTYEICQFLHDVLKVSSFNVSFPHKVGLHASCHGLRGLREASATELMVEPYSIYKDLLKGVRDLELVQLERPDECCGFGGTFAVSEEAVSVAMGIDRVKDHHRHGAEVIVSADMSCLMHLDGLMRRNKIPLRAHHIVEILNGSVS